MSSEEQLVPGMQIKNYVLEEQLGKGASGEVWKANDGMKTVALKLMNPQLLTSRNAAKHLSRMQREIEALGRLQSHPNIPSIFEYDLNYERPYMAMQYIGGASYEKLIKSGDMLRIPLSTRLRMIRELAMALAAAHRENIIHRDIKPANASGTENPYLLDFSVALPEEDLQKTQANIGTKLYMPWDGIPDKLGDIYSFGLLAYEIIFGRHAIFRPEDSAMLKATPFMPQVVAGERVKNREWHVPSKLALDEIPADLVGKDLRPLDEVFQKVLGSRAQRYEDPRTFAEDMRRAIEEGVAPPQQPESTPPQAVQPPAQPVQPTPVPTPPPPAPEPAAPAPKPPEPPHVEPSHIAEDSATMVEDFSMASTPHEPHAAPDDYQPTVVEPPPAPPAQPAPSFPDDMDGGKTMLEIPIAPKAPPEPASRTPMPVRQQPPAAPPEPPRRTPPPSLEPERPMPAPPMPAQSEAMIRTQLDAEPPKAARSRSPVVFIAAGLAALVLIAIIVVVIVSGSQAPPTTATVTPGEIVQVDVTETPTDVPTQVVIAATEVEQTATPTDIPPTATRRPTNTPVPATETLIPTDTPVPPTATTVPSNTPIPPSETPVPTDTPVPPTNTPVPPTNTPVPTDTPIPSDTPVPPSDTPVPTDTPIPPTATRVPSDTPTPIPPTATRRPTATPVSVQVEATATEAIATEIPPTATRVGAEATATPDVPTATPTPEGLNASLVANIRLLRLAILGDTYQCSVFNKVYEHLEMRVEGDFEGNADYERYGDDILREMGRIYRGFCRNQDTDDERLPRRYEEDNSDLDVLLEDILEVLALTATPTPMV
jgi:serine/threonine protein kinase